MEVEEFESYLTIDELAKFKKILKGSYRTHVESEETHSVISRAFLWADTDEGNNYWYEIQDRLKKGEPLTPGYLKGHQYMQFFTADQWSKLCAIAMEFLGVEGYQKWMGAAHVNITQFLGTGVPTSKQSKFITNIRVADSTIFRLTRGYKVKPGEFLTKEDTCSSAYTSTTHTRLAL